MSADQIEDANCQPPDCDGVSQVIDPTEKDLGEFVVRRVLPAREQRRVGPFIFFDHMGPSTFDAGSGINVRPHPHIGLSTLTYLFEGEILHRDSLGYVQPIQPGAVNWMTAGKGIVHSERTPEALLATGYTLHGIQSWIALPDDHEEEAPAFHHYPADSLPKLNDSGIEMTLIAGSAYGELSPIDTFSPLFYLDINADEGSTIVLPDHEERALYVVSGAISIGNQQFEAGRMVVIEPRAQASIRAKSNCRIMALGGDPIGDRIVWWNFSSSSKDRLEQAKSDWQAGRFPAIPGETEFIPLPE